MNPLPLTTHQRNSAFSLIEVALALVVITVGFIGLAALLPSGQERMIGAVHTTLATQLAQRVAAEMERTDFSEVLRSAGLDGPSALELGWLPRRYFSAAEREVAQDDPERIYELHTRAVRSGQLPDGAGGARWTSRGHLVLTLEVVAARAGLQATLGSDGRVDRTRGPPPVAVFPFALGGHAP